jgi:hypothetical protein
MWHCMVLMTFSLNPMYRRFDDRPANMDFGLKDKPQARTYDRIFAPQNEQDEKF